MCIRDRWFTPLREALSAFVDKTQETVTGTVKLKLYKGNLINAGVTSPYSLYDEEIATFEEEMCIRDSSRTISSSVVRSAVTDGGSASRRTSASAA